MRGKPNLILPNIFLACQFRSGSTHISNVIQKVCGLRKMSTAGLHGEGMESQDINPQTAMLLFPLPGQVFQQHTKGTPRNYMLLNQYNMKPVVLIRNIFDSLTSIHDWMWSGNGQVIPGITIPHEWQEWEQEDRIRYLVVNAVPWIYSFYATWSDAGRENRIRAYPIKYEEFYADQEEGFRKLFAFYGLPYNKWSLKLAVRQKGWTFNKGVSGRGIPFLGPHFCKRIRDMAAVWGPRTEKNILRNLL